MLYDDPVEDEILRGIDNFIYENKSLIPPLAFYRIALEFCLILHIELSSLQKAALRVAKNKENNADEEISRYKGLINEDIGKSIGRNDSLNRLISASLSRDIPCNITNIEYLFEWGRDCELSAREMASSVYRVIAPNHYFDIHSLSLRNNKSR